MNTRRFKSFTCYGVLLFVHCIVLSGNSVIAQERVPVRFSNGSSRIYLSSSFASRVIDYFPGEGQFVNDPNFNNPAKALGAPVGGGTANPDETKLVTLGGFGGSITLGFDYTVRNDANNPFGIDCIVFGNAFFVGGNPDIRFAEAAIIEISRDVNENGIADDPWYLIPGSDLPDPVNQMRNGYFVLPDIPYASPPLFNENTDGTESFWGYGDMTPVLLLGDLDGDNVIDNPFIKPNMFYTMPDDPWTVGITPGSGGGDGFDIAWAVDPVTNLPAGLGGFDFIRITTGADGSAGQFGEVSTEIGGVAAVAPPVMIWKR